MPRHEQREISFDVPRHWEERTIVAFAAPKEPAQVVAANLVMTHDTLRDRETLGDYADRQLAELSKRLDAFELIRREATTLGGASAVAIRFAARASNAVLEQRLVVVEGRRRGVFCFTATTSKADADQNNPLFDRILSTVRLAEGPKEGAG
jgi:hypothetical protein